ncbi:MAG: ImmA/IrrE family metallo-endopeptidase [Chloroflexi bacterium]|nr:ImmA/IrrE family metallo-endopeptidase [Chloroflexota bacterium]MBV9895968.1 ImmA/IrrE family metallo-endopeptidase [Chloroflexota bacterium]
MVRWLRDASGRFPRRPHYEAAELESVCADLHAELRRIRPPTEQRTVTTDDLTVLIEHHAADLDLYADLPPGLDAVTDFASDVRPRVRVAARLSESARSTNRLRTTLAHELAHVVLHNFIWWFPPDPGVAFDPAALSPRCALKARASDWMEWQANYCAGALLIPAVAIADAQAPVWERSSAGRALIRSVQSDFEVSAQAATIRLRQLGRLSDRPAYIVRAPLPRTW